MTRIRFTGVERGGHRTAYTAVIELDSEAVGYVQKVRGEEEYVARVGGVVAATGRTLADMRAELRDYFATEHPGARESW